jgi:hypothetical protein
VSGVCDSVGIEEEEEEEEVIDKVTTWLGRWWSERIGREG